MAKNAANPTKASTRRRAQTTDDAVKNDYGGTLEKINTATGMILDVASRNVYKTIANALGDPSMSNEEIDLLTHDSRQFFLALAAMGKEPGNVGIYDGSALDDDGKLKPEYADALLMTDTVIPKSRQLPGSAKPTGENVSYSSVYGKVRSIVTTDGARDKAKKLGQTDDVLKKYLTPGPRKGDFKVDKAYIPEVTARLQELFPSTIGAGGDGDELVPFTYLLQRMQEFRGSGNADNRKKIRDLAIGDEPDRKLQRYLKPGTRKNSIVFKKKNEHLARRRIKELLGTDDDTDDTNDDGTTTLSKALAYKTVTDMAIKYKGMGAIKRFSAKIKEHAEAQEYIEKLTATKTKVKNVAKIREIANNIATEVEYDIIKDIIKEDLGLDDEQIQSTYGDITEVLTSAQIETRFEIPVTDLQEYADNTEFSAILGKPVKTVDELGEGYTTGKILLLKQALKKQNQTQQPQDE